MVHNMYRCYLTFAAANGKIRKSHGDAIDPTEIEAGVVAWLIRVYSQMAQARAQKRQSIITIVEDSSSSAQIHRYLREGG